MGTLLRGLREWQQDTTLNQSDRGSTAATSPAQISPFSSLRLLWPRAPHPWSCSSSFPTTSWYRVRLREQCRGAERWHSPLSWFRRSSVSSCRGALISCVRGFLDPAFGCLSTLCGALLHLVTRIFGRIPGLIPSGLYVVFHAIVLARGRRLTPSENRCKDQGGAQSHCSEGPLCSHAPEHTACLRNHAIHLSQRSRIDVRRLRGNGR